MERVPAETVPAVPVQPSVAASVEHVPAQALQPGADDAPVVVGSVELSADASSSAADFVVPSNLMAAFAEFCKANPRALQFVPGRQAPAQPSVPVPNKTHSGVAAHGPDSAQLSAAMQPQGSQTPGIALPCVTAPVQPPNQPAQPAVAQPPLQSTAAAEVQVLLGCQRACLSCHRQS